MPRAGRSHQRQERARSAARQRLPLRRQQRHHRPVGLHPLQLQRQPRRAVARQPHAGLRDRAGVPQDDRVPLRPQVGQRQEEGVFARPVLGARRRQRVHRPQRLPAPAQPAVPLLAREGLPQGRVGMVEAVHTGPHGLLVDHQTGGGAGGPGPEGVLQLRRLLRRQGGMDVGDAPVEAVVGLVVAATGVGVPVHAAHVVTRVLEHEAVAPHHRGDAVVAAGEAEGEAAGVQQAGADRRVAAHSPAVLGPVGVIVEAGAPLRPRVVAGQRQEGVGPLEHRRQMLQTLRQVDVGVEEQGDRIGFPGHQPQPVGVGEAGVVAEEVAGHRPLRRGGRPVLHQKHQLADQRVLAVVGQAGIDLPLALRLARPVVLAVNDDAHTAAQFTAPGRMGEVCRAAPADQGNNTCGRRT